jgi:hypothetical protein
MAARHPARRPVVVQERRAPGLTSRGRINATGCKENELEAEVVPPSTISDRSEGAATTGDLADSEGDEIDANNHHKSKQASVNETGGIASNEFRHRVTPSKRRPGRQRGLAGSGVDARASLQTSKVRSVKNNASALLLVPLLASVFGRQCVVNAHLRSFEYLGQVGSLQLEEAGIGECRNGHACCEEAHQPALVEFRFDLVAAIIRYVPLHQGLYWPPSYCQRRQLRFVRTVKSGRGAVESPKSDWLQTGRAVTRGFFFTPGGFSSPHANFFR